MSENQLKIYKIKIPDEYVSWDCNDSMMVIAETRTRARQLASEKAGDEGSQVWLIKSKVKWIGRALNRMKEKVVLNSYNAG